MNGIDVLEQDGFREIRGSNPSSPRAVGVITNQTGFDVEGRRTIDVLAQAPGIKLVAIFSPEHGVTGELDINSVGDSVDRATGVHVYSIYESSHVRLMSASLEFPLRRADHGWPLSAWTELLVPQGERRVNTHGSACGNVARGQRDKRQQR